MTERPILKQLRAEIAHQGWTPTELAKRLGVARPCVYSMLQADKYMSEKTIYELAHALGFQVEGLTLRRIDSSANE